MKPAMLTTIDNPYDPFTQFEEWNAYDMQKGYHTCSYLARVTTSTDEFGDLIENESIDRAMNEIVDLNLIGLYKKVHPEDYKD